MDRIVNLPTATIHITDDQVTCTFPDGSVVTCDVTKAKNPVYRKYAQACGYDNPVIYAWHHDLVHCWLAYKLRGVSSATLWAVANRLSPPPENEQEEHLVNTVQWALATGKWDYHEDYFYQEMGPGWGLILMELHSLLLELGLPPSSPRTWEELSQRPDKS